MKAVFGSIFIFYRFLKVASLTVSEIVAIAFYYLLITIFDLVGLGALFLLLSTYLSGNSSLVLDSIFEYKIDVTLLFFILPSLWLAKFVIVLVANKRIIRFSQSLVSKIRIEIVRNTFENKFPSTNLLGRDVWLDTLNRQLSYTASGIIEPAIRGFFDLLLLVAAWFYIFFLAPEMLTVLTLWLLFGLLCFDLLVRNRIKTMGYEYNLALERLTYDLNTLNNGLAEFWALRASRFFMDRLMSKSRVIVSKYSDFATFTMAPRLFLEVLLVVGVVGAIFLVEAIGLERDKLILSLSIIGVGVFRMLPLVNSFNLAINQLRSGSRTMDNVIAFIKGLDVEPSTSEIRGRLIGIEAIDVSKNFGDEVVLSDFSLSVQKGTTVAIVGPSGCGKTTLAEIITAVSRPDSGTVMITTDLGEQHPLAESKMRIGFVAQTPILINGTVFENILLDSSQSELEPANQMKLTEALEYSGFGEVVSSFNDGLNTEIGTYGRKLSGGETQKLSICRALYASDGLLVFDEPTSAYDKTSENYFFDVLEKIKDKFIILVITHAISHQNKFDKVVHFQGNGEITISDI